MFVLADTIVQREAPIFSPNRMLNFGAFGILWALVQVVALVEVEGDHLLPPDFIAHHIVSNPIFETHAESWHFFFHVAIEILLLAPLVSVSAHAFKAVTAPKPSVDKVVSALKRNFWPAWEAYVKAFAMVKIIEFVLQSLMNDFSRHFLFSLGFPFALGLLLSPQLYEEPELEVLPPPSGRGSLVPFIVGTVMSAIALPFGIRVGGSTKLLVHDTPLDGQSANGGKFAGLVAFVATAVGVVKSQNQEIPSIRLPPSISKPVVPVKQLPSTTGLPYRPLPPSPDLKSAPVPAPPTPAPVPVLAPAPEPVELLVGGTPTNLEPVEVPSWSWVALLTAIATAVTSGPGI